MYTSIATTGRVTADLELQYGQNENSTPYVQFSLAVNKGYGEHEHANFFQCVVFGASAERMGKTGVKKGSLIAVTGDLDLTEFTRKSDGSKGTVDEKGYAQVTKLRILRAEQDSKGTIRKIPWYIEIENGKGIPQKNANGGTYMKANSFVSTARVFANLTDLDLFKLLSRTVSYIDAWEKAVAPSLIRTARKSIAERMSQTAA